MSMYYRSTLALEIDELEGFGTVILPNLMLGLILACSLADFDDNICLL